MTLHLTAGSNAYLEVRSRVSHVYAKPHHLAKGTWLWVADHDLDGDGEQLTIWAGRGLLSESQGPVWMIGTAGTSSKFAYVHETY